MECLEENYMVAAIDSMSSGKNESQDSVNLMEWESRPNRKKNLQKKTHLHATRQSSRLKCHGAKTDEELATKRKQVLNLEVSGHNNTNSFDVLNNINDDYLADTVKDLGINLANDREGCLAQISTTKTEAMLRADLA
jgi:hypothetical protein